ncbi:MAG: phosphomannomutase/phosphoglucomutase [Planctomycetes bacterium]|nr:phosphomannomutase/phosphoglucomutase [Planctomycetota bacterium]
MNPAIFREYDIRGLVGPDLDAEVVRVIAQAFGTRLVRAGGRSCALGRDVRHSSAPFADAVAEGLAATGLRVLDCGEVPTPVLYFGILELEADGGIMITGSHNPIDYNGLKICQGTLALSGDEIQDIRRIAEAGDFATGDGSRETVDVVPAYRSQLLARFSLKSKPLVAVDCGNGVAGPLVVSILEAAGCRLEALYCDPDGSFPNHLPDPEVPEYMRDLVAEVEKKQAAVGFGFDGDGDRLGVIDATGTKISADWLIAVFARDLLSRHPGGVIRYDVKCGDFLADDVRAHGGEPVMGRTGHSILKKDIKALNAVLGGELSGHIVFGREYHLIDDPIYCALKILSLMEQKNVSCRGLFEGIPETFATAEIKAPTPDDQKFRIVAELVEAFRAAGYDVIDIDGARVPVPEAQGWGLVRASNTTANLTLRFESRTREGLAQVRAIFVEQLARHPAIDLGRLRGAL